MTINAKQTPSYKPFLYWTKKEDGQYSVYETQQWQELVPGEGYLLRSKTMLIATCESFAPAHTISRLLEQQYNS